MALSTVDKVKIQNYMKTRPMGGMYYEELLELLGKKQKPKHSEFLEYFTECTLAEFRKNEKIYSKTVGKLISCVEYFVEKIKKENIEVEETLLDKVRSVKDYYNEYRARVEVEFDDTLIEDNLGMLEDTLEKLYKTEDKPQESLSKYIDKITELEEEIKRLEREIKEANKINEIANKTISQKQERVEALSNQLTTVTNDLSKKTKEVSESSEIIADLTSQIEKLKTELAALTQENTDLTSIKEKFEALTEEVKTLKKQIRDEKTAKTKATNLATKQENIEELIYQRLLVDNYSIDELLEVITSNGLKTTRDEVFELLNRMKREINITSPSFKLEPEYKIVQPQLTEGTKFTISVPVGAKYYDVMLVSDFHIEELNSKVIEGFDYINDYCAANGISLVLNLGDFFEGIGTKYVKYQNALENYQLIEKTIKTLPQAKGIYHGILGGNHDRNIASYGFDPIKMLTEGRSDFVNLGYTHSTIEIKTPTIKLGEFDIHHPYTFDFPIDLDQDVSDIIDMNEYLESIYNTQGRDRDASYVDILGHTHRSQYNTPESYCFIPSYYGSRAKRGACHLRIYFDEDTEIKYMVFMPLVLNPKLVKSSEIFHKKVLKNR